jgi:hypothetical protein
MLLPLLPHLTAASSSATTQPEQPHLHASPSLVSLSVPSFSDLQLSYDILSIAKKSRAFAVVSTFSIRSFIGGQFCTPAEDKFTQAQHTLSKADFPE